MKRDDWREPRDWARAWRDRPGLICCCAPTPPVCGCNNLIFSDDFSSALSGYTTRGSGWSVGSGVLNNVNGTGTGNNAYYRMFPTPPLNGLCITAQCRFVGGLSNATSQLGIGGIAPNYGLTFGSIDHNCCTNDLKAPFAPCGGNMDYTGCGTMTAGVCCINIVDTSAGAGSYTVKIFLGGVLQCTKTNVLLSFDTTFAVGFMHTTVTLPSSAAWDDLKVWTN